MGPTEFLCIAWRVDTLSIAGCKGHLLSSNKSAGGLSMAVAVKCAASLTAWKKLE